MGNGAWVLTIRNEQKAAFAAVMRESFTSEVLGYLQERFPNDCPALGEDQTRVVIGIGTDRAATYGFDTRGNVYDYIALMFSLGGYFDEDPLLPWASEALAAAEETNQHVLMEDLYTRATDYIGRVVAHDGSLRNDARLRARERPLTALPSVGRGDLADDLRAHLSDLYPEKWEALDEAALRQVIRLCRARADAYGIGRGRGPALYAGLMFLFGGHFDRDPLHPWAEAVLKDESVSDAILKSERLHEAAIARLDPSLISA
jgi:hypothetical protein